MNKVLKKVGLSAVVATFVFGLAGTSSALTVQDPDNETANITANADVFVEATNDATYSETENYTLTLDNSTKNSTNNNKTKINYTKDFKATNGQTHVVSSFDAVGVATATKPNITTSNKVVFNTMYEGYNTGSFTGTEKIQYQRCQPAGSTTTSFCATNSQTAPRAHGDVAMGSEFNVKYASITTGADATVAQYRTNGSYTLLPSVNYNIAAAGTGVTGQPDLAVGSVKAGMAANVVEISGNNGNNATSTMAYEQHTAANGYIKFAKTMKYNSNLRGAATTTNLSRVP